VSLSSVTPVSGWRSNQYIRIEGESKSRLVDLLDIGPEYFDTLQVPVIAGRTITERDIQTGTKVAMINQAGARKFFRIAPRWAGGSTGRRSRSGWSRSSA